MQIKKQLETRTQICARVDVVWDMYMFSSIKEQETMGDYKRLWETARDYGRLQETMGDYKRLWETIRDYERPWETARDYGRL